MYRSRSWLDHFLKGAVAAAAYWGFFQAAQAHQPVLALALLLLGLVVVGGCPTCWLVGLLDMMRDPPLKGDCVDGVCTVRLARRQDGAQPPATGSLDRGDAP